MRRNNGWTAERRARQAELLRRLRPWLKSTGPKSESGKANSKMNAEKHGGRGRLTSVARLRRVLRLIGTFKKPQSRD